MDERRMEFPRLHGRTLSERDARVGQCAARAEPRAAELPIATSFETDSIQSLILQIGGRIRGRAPRLSAQKMARTLP
jgi:hypothetical protein